MIDKDLILTIINGVFLLLSGISAVKSVQKYKQIKYLSNYSNINYCYLGFCEIEKQLNSILILSKKHSRGTKGLIQIAENIKKLLIDIRQHLTTDEYKVISSIFNNKIDTYIDSLIISNDIICGCIYEEQHKQYYDNVQKAQIYLKEKKEKIEDGKKSK